MDNQEKNKNRILIIGVGFFSLLIFSLWLLSVNRVIFHSSANLNQEEGQGYWQGLQEEINRGFMNMGEVWEELTDSEIKVETDEFIDEFKDRVASEILKKEEIDNEEIIGEDNLELIEEENLTINCPEFVNCMPTLDAPFEICSVPPGCEDITLKVY